MTTTTKNLTVELTELSAIKPYEKNAKKHSNEQIETLSGLIKRHGWTQPIVVDVDGIIIAGHGRRLAAIKLGLKKVPVVWRRDLTKVEAAALRLSDNRVVSTQFDTMIEQEELVILDDAGFDISNMGYTEKELGFLASDLGTIDEGIFVEDVSQAVEAQKDANEHNVRDMDQSAAAIGDAFGFKRVTIEESRAIRIFMGGIEVKTGLKGVAALLSYIGSHS